MNALPNILLEAANRNDEDNAMPDMGKKAFYSLILVMGIILPIAFFVLVSFWEKKFKQKCEREEAKRRLVSTKLAEPIRETYLLNLMEGYNMVLSKSDIYDGDHYDSDEEAGTSKGEATTETCVESLSSSSQSISDESVSDRMEEDFDVDVDVDVRVGVGNLPENDDIEMQRPKSKPSEQEEENADADDDADMNSLECDNSQCHHCSFRIPLQGQKVVSCNDDGDNATLSAAAIDTSLQTRAHSEGCVICMNPFEIGQTITWSSNPNCTHVFHHQCLLEWFTAVGQKAWKAKTRLREGSLERDDRDTTTIQNQICDFPKLCPFCRRDYFLEDIWSTPQEEAEDDNNNENNHSNRNSTENEDEGNNNNNPILPSPVIETEEEVC